MTHVSEGCFLASIQIWAASLILQDDRVARLAPGDFALDDSTRPCALHFLRLLADGLGGRRMGRLPLRDLVLPPPRFVFAGTASAYGAQLPPLVDEHSLPHTATGAWRGSPPAAATRGRPGASGRCGRQAVVEVHPHQLRRARAVGGRQRRHHRPVLGQ